MAITTIIPGENSDLELHVNLCQERYLDLTSKIDSIVDRTERTQQTLQELKDLIVNSRHTGITTLNRVIITALAMIVSILLGSIGWLITHQLNLIH